MSVWKRLKIKLYTEEKRRFVFLFLIYIYLLTFTLRSLELVE